MSDLRNDPEMDDQSDELDPNDVDALRSELDKKEQDIQKLKGHWGAEKSELLQAQRMLEQKVAQLEGRVGEQRELFNSSRAPEKDPFELDEERIEEFNNNPAKITEFVKEYTESRLKVLVDAVTARDQYYESSIQNTRGMVEDVKREFDPDRMAWRDSIEELRKNERLAKLDDEILIEIAKTQGKAPAMEYRGAAGGGAHRAQSYKPIAFDPERQDCNIFLQVAGGNVEKAKRMWENSQNKKAGK